MPQHQKWNASLIDRAGEFVLSTRHGLEDRTIPTDTWEAALSGCVSKGVGGLVHFPKSLLTMSSLDDSLALRKGM